MDIRGGNDVLKGGAGNDHLFGDAGSLLGKADPGGPLTVTGTARGGNDTLSGGAGTDAFYFANPTNPTGVVRDSTGAFGDDTITDAEDGERLVFRNYAGRQADFQVTENGDRTVISIDDNSVTLLGVTGLGGGQQSGGDLIFIV
jgi:Ca2+-binding RTX toxin-like protein